MEKIKKLNFKDFTENFKNFLPEWQLVFCNYPIFTHLIKSLWDYIESKEEDRFDKYMIFLNYIENFQHLCNTDPEGIKRKEECEIEKINNNRHLNLMKLYGKYLDEIKRTKIE